ncbi:hypothetical protein [Calothrix sp. PCC 6303]|nr:hypothetical protein [Calothrix sp. PCC 6303]
MQYSSWSGAVRGLSNQDVEATSKVTKLEARELNVRLREIVR